MENIETAQARMQVQAYRLFQLTEKPFDRLVILDITKTLDDLKRDAADVGKKLPVA